MSISFLNGICRIDGKLMSFALKLWNRTKIIDLSIIGTTLAWKDSNICQVWNNKFFNLVGLYHPSVWRVIGWFQREESTVSTIIQQYPAGTLTASKKSSSTLRAAIRMPSQLVCCSTGGPQVCGGVLSWPRLQYSS